MFALLKKFTVHAFRYLMVGDGKPLHNNSAEMEGPPRLTGIKPAASEVNNLLFYQCSRITPVRLSASELPAQDEIWQFFFEI